MPVTSQALSSHLGIGGRVAGQALGYLPGSVEATTTGAIDLDAKDFPGEGMEEARRAVLECCAGLNINAYPERSSSGQGWHIWTFSDASLPYATMRDALRAVTRRAGLPDTVETYPMGASGAAGRWIITPYAQALSGRDGVRPRLGLTFLEDENGQPIPVDELDDWFTPNPAARLTALAAEIKPAPSLTPLPTGAVGDLDPRAVPLLLEVVRGKAPPARHDALGACLNVGQRAGDLEGMAHGLKDPAVWRVWCADGSRTLEDWAAEVDGWAAHVAEGKEGNTRGLTYLREECGYELPTLPKRGEKENDGDEKERRSSASSRVMDYAREDGAELWHDQGGAAYLTATVNGHREHYRLPSTPARDYLQALFYTREKRPLNAQAQGEAVAVMQALARREGQQHRTAVRLTHLDGFTYLDLGTPTWEAVEVGPGYWKTIGPHDCPVRFTRPAGLLALSAPDQGGSLAELREYLNTDDRGFLMCMAWVLGALSGLSPFPVLALSGEQGTGKSTAATVLRNLIDPHEADRRRAPKEERDLFITAQAAHVLCYDNLSSIQGWLSDGLCVLSTGGAFTARTLYSDGDETILKAVRPVIINGIPDLLARPDLAERALTVTLYRIPSAKRIPEKVFWARYERARPRLLGALLTALAEGLRHLDGTELEHAPRLADFARLIVAAEGALPWTAGAFLDAYGQMQSEAAGTVLDGEPVAEALRALMDDGAEWFGTVKALLTALDDQEGYPDEHRPPQGWPRTPKALGGSLRRLAPALSKTGYRVTPEGRSREGERYRLSKEMDSTCTTYTPPTKPRQDDEKPGVLQERPSTHGGGNVHTAGTGVYFGGSGVNIEPGNVHPENGVSDGAGVLGVDDAHSISLFRVGDDSAQPARDGLDWGAEEGEDLPGAVKL